MALHFILKFYRLTIALVPSAKHPTKALENKHHGIWNNQINSEDYCQFDANSTDPTDLQTVE
jgi:hypothetical protein